jgi:hypothetical protein
MGIGSAKSGLIESTEVRRLTSSVKASEPKKIRVYFIATSGTHNALLD